MDVLAFSPADRRVLVAASVLFIELTDATVILTALPSMAASFGVAPNAMSIGLTAYAVAAAAFIPASGWAADRIGARRLLVCALVLFVVSSLLCAVSQTLEVFVASRVAQGMAGAMMVPVARLLVLSDADPSAMMRTIAILTWPALIAPLAAPVIGGALAEYAGWRFIFVLNAPIGLLAMCAVLMVFKPTDWPPRARKLDGPGLLFAAAAGAGVVWALDLAVRAESLWLGALAGACTAFALLVWRIHHTASPIIKPSLFAIRTFAVSSAQSGLFMRIAINATPYLIPLMFQLTHAMRPAEAGAMLMVYMIGNVAIKPATNMILRRWTFRNTLACNGLVSAAALAALAFTDVSTSLWIVSSILFVAGLSRSLNFTATNTLTFADIPRHERNDASTLVSVLQQAALSLGVGVGAALLSFSLQLRGAASLQASDFTAALLAISAVMAASACGYFAALPKNAGDNLTA
jgi:EmrB/QacA subfamily drug resistance transporter